MCLNGSIQGVYHWKRNHVFSVSPLQSYFLPPNQSQQPSNNIWHLIVSGYENTKELSCVTDSDQRFPSKFDKLLNAKDINISHFVIGQGQKNCNG